MRLGEFYDYAQSVSDLSEEIEETLLAQAEAESEYEDDALFVANRIEGMRLAISSSEQDETAFNELNDVIGALPDDLTGGALDALQQYEDFFYQREQTGEKVAALLEEALQEENEDKLLEALDLSGELGEAEEQQIEEAIDELANLRREEKTQVEEAEIVEEEEGDISYYDASPLLDIVEEVAALRDMMSDGETDQQTFDELAEPLYHALLEQAEAPGGFQQAVDDTWSALENMEGYAHGKTQFIDFTPVEGVQVLSEEKWLQSDIRKEEGVSLRGTYSTIEEAQAWVAEIGAPVFIVVEHENIDGKVIYLVFETGSL